MRPYKRTGQAAETKGLVVIIDSECFGLGAFPCSPRDLESSATSPAFMNAMVDDRGGRSWAMTRQFLGTGLLSIRALEPAFFFFQVLVLATFVFVVVVVTIPFENLIRTGYMSLVFIV